MKKRSIKKQFYMNRDEAQELRKKAKAACMSEAMLIRFLVAGYIPPTAPDERFYEAMELLRELYGKLDSFKDKIDDVPTIKFINDEIHSWKKFRIALEARYLLPERMSKKWQ